MNLAKWNPSAELEEVANRLNRIFGRSPVRTEPNNEMLAMADWAPSVDISETDTAYLVKAEIPGVKKEDVKVTIQNGMLTLQGERRQEKEEKGKKFHRIERCYGSFMRSFRVFILPVAWAKRCIMPIRVSCNSTTTRNKICCA